jgi:hypothetical protein
MTTERPLRVAVACLGYWGPGIARTFAGPVFAWCCDAGDELPRHALGGIDRELV